MSTQDITILNPSSFEPVTTRTWSNGRHAVRCVKVIQETWDVKTFNFMAEQPAIFFFKPGQFVTLELPIEQETIFRSYTISSSPSVPYSFSITVKRVPGGLVSNWLHDNIQEGMELAVHGPVGQFNCIDFPSRKVLFLSGGVGITPMMSMARWYFDTSADVDMEFVHSARTPEDIVFKRDLENMAARIPSFKLSLVCERYTSGQHWSGYRGFFSYAMLEMIAPDYREREIFCCGPTPYMNAVKKMLQEAGFAMHRYHEESFGATPAPAKEQAKQEAEEAESIADALETADLNLVSFASHGKSVQIAPGETIHAAAAKSGITIPKACGMGICGTCKVKCLQGEVEMNHNGGITDEDVEEGYILSCCSVPQGNVVIEI